jgi:DNA polymerase-3 subunit gamma/tau
MDVLEIDGASNNGVEQVRELRETCRYVPASSKFKIYIIDEVHMLSTAAFNALLKTLEEPPAHVKFMFATTDPEKVLATILSRCQRFDLRRIPAALIVRHLTHIAKLEQVKIDDAALYAIARGADGGMRDAESALDQLISFCGDQILEPDVLSMFGLTAKRQILALASGILAGETEKVLRELNELAKHGKDLSRLFSELLEHFRNLLIYQVSGGDLKLLEVSEAETTSLPEQSALVNTDGLARIMEVLTDAEGRLREAPSKKIFIEVALIKAMQARKSVSLDDVLQQLQRLRGEDEGTTPAGAEMSQAVSRAGELKLAQVASSGPPPVAPAVSASARAVDANLETLWRNVIEAVGRASPFTRSYLLEAHPVSFDKNIFTIGFDPEFADHLDLVNNAKNHTLIQTKLQELGHGNVQVKFIQAEAPARPAGTAETASQATPVSVDPASKPTGATASAPKAQNEKAPSPAASSKANDFKNDPLIQKALEIFKGQIVEVRT